MAKSLKQVVEQIRRLEQEAEALRKTEVSGVIERIRTAIEHYGLTPQELFGGQRGPSTAIASKRPRRQNAAVSRTPPKRPGTAKYAGPDGRTWTGTGKRPRWFVEALASGKTTDELLIQHSAPPDASTPTGRESGRSATGSKVSKAAKASRTSNGSKAAKRGKAARTGVPRKANGVKKTLGTPKFHDGAGKTWTGVGKRPNWFVQALAAGRTAEDLLIQVQ